MDSYIVKYFFKPFEALLDSLFKPVANMLNDKMFLMDNPFLNSEFVHKYLFIQWQAQKIMWALLIFGIVLTIFSFEKRQLIQFVSETITAIALMYGNMSILFIMNYMFKALSYGISGEVASKIFDFFVAGLAASIVLVLNPALLMIGIGLGVCFFLLFAGLDMLELASQVFILISPIMISFYPFKSLRSYTHMFYKVILSINLAVLFQGAVFFVALLSGKANDPFSRLTVGISSIILCIVVAPMILFKAIGSTSKGVD